VRVYKGNFSKRLVDGVLMLLRDYRFILA